MRSGSPTSEQTARFERAAHNLADSFVNTENIANRARVMSHLARAALACSEARFDFDVLSGHAGPPALVTPQVGEAVADYVRWFPSCIGYEAIPPRRVSSARLSVVFDLGNVSEPRSWEPDAPRGVPYRCEVALEDREGTVHRACLEGTWEAVQIHAERPRRFWWQFWRAVD